LSIDESHMPYSVMTQTIPYTVERAAAIHISGRELPKSVVLWAGGEMLLPVLPVNLICDARCMCDRRARQSKAKKG
jgi:hypothetical protein